MKKGESEKKIRNLYNPIQENIPLMTPMIANKISRQIKILLNLLEKKAQKIFINNKIILSKIIIYFGDHI